MGRLKTVFRKCKTAITLDNKMKIDFLKTFIYMGAARAFILFVPFNKLRKRMGKLKEESPDNVEDEVYKSAKKVTSLVMWVANKTPWESKCLVQALTAQKLLHEKGISTTLYLGVKKDGDNNMLAHAWLRCGSYYVTGGFNKEGYAVVAKFTK